MNQGILERIEANQLTILALLQASPVAIQATLESTIVEPVKIVEPLPDLSGDEPFESDIELDTDGVPWDERIHSSNKKRSKGGSGSWMKRKGVDKDEPGKYARITAELREKYSGQSGASRPHTTDGIPTPLPPAAPGTPPPPASTASSGLPPPPGTGNVTKEEVPTRKIAIDAINALVKKHNVNYDAITQYFIDNYNASGFEDISPIKHDGVIEDVNDWSGKMKIVGTQIADIKQIYANDISVIEPYIVQVWEMAHLDGVVCDNYTDVPFDQLDKVMEALTALHTQCVSA